MSRLSILTSCIRPLWAWVPKGFSGVLATATVLSHMALGGEVEGNKVDYSREIKAVFKNKCYACHGALKQEGGLRVDTVSMMRQGGDSGAAVVAGSAEDSYLMQRITATDEYDRMPPEGEPLTPEQIERVKEWIESGAEGPADEVPQVDPNEHWAYQPLDFKQAESSASLDTFIDARLSSAGLSRAPRADRRTLIRRLYLDMHGLPPTPQQIDNFVNDDRPEAWAELVESVLTSPRYGERWAQHWLDVVRYADTHGFEVNTPRPNAWPYRDYVIAAFNSDKPYDQFVREQIAGDQMGIDPATGFLVAAPVLLPGQIGADEASKRLARQDSLDEVIVGTGGTFLGMTIGCARCHDHKFDPISREDYYALQSFFAGVEYDDRQWVDDGYRQRVQQAEQLQPRIDHLEAIFQSYQPSAFIGQTLLIDDEDLDRVTLLKEKNGHGVNPEQSARGFRDDVGDARRFGNLSQGRYTWWDNVPGEDVFTWNPNVSGQFQLWISWGVHGSGVHTRDARYVLDRDGDLSTQEDQRELARADQYYFAGVTQGETLMTPLWSGLQYVGIHEWNPESRLILRGGETGTGITADVIVLQEVLAQTSAAEADDSPLPALRDPVNARLNIESFAPQPAKLVRFTIRATHQDNLREPCLDELEVFSVNDPSRNVALAKFGTVATSSGNYSETGIHQLKHINEGQYGNSHSWISNQTGGGWIQLEFPQIETINRIQWGRDREEQFTDRLAIDYSIEISVDGRTWTEVASSSDRLPQGTPTDEVQSLLRSGAAAGFSDVQQQAKELEELKHQQQEWLEPPMVYGGSFREPDETFVLNRGDPEQPIEPIGPRFPEILGGEALSEDTPEDQRRLELATWITDPSHPLTARVMVNRIWQYHFGIGLVETSSDFGLNGAQPSHPELLDWLAIRFIDGDWSVKEIHRTILMSETYCQSNRILPEAQRVDGDCRLLWRFPSRRLEAEAIRDSVLAASGQLNLKMGGPGFDFFSTRGGLSGFPPIESFGPEQLRRMIYSHKIRMEPVPVFGAFDCPDAGQAMPRRSVSTTAIQALNLFNSPFIAEQSQSLAERIERESPGSLETQIDQAFVLTVGRSPNPTELTASLDVARQHGIATVCRVLYNSNEFLFLP